MCVSSHSLAVADRSGEDAWQNSLISISFSFSLLSLFLSLSSPILILSPNSGLRSGTVPTPLVVGLGAACEIALQEMAVREGRECGGLRERWTMSMWTLHNGHVASLIPFLVSCVYKSLRSLDGSRSHPALVGQACSRHYGARSRGHSQRRQHRLSWMC